MFFCRMEAVFIGRESQWLILVRSWRWEGEYVIMGDFNEDRSEHERFGSLFNVQGVNAFNNFISMSNLIDLPLEGYDFTWAHKTANKMSKLDRFLISRGLLSLFPSLSALCLDRHLYDYRPIFMRELNIDYGLTPFQIFHSWFDIEGLDKLVEDTWLNTIIEDSNDLDKILDQGGSNEDILNTRSTLLKELHDINSVESLEKAQKAKICWAIEGDENSKYFHGEFSSGCNFSFIALIPKIHDAKVVTDFRLISLIRSLYKIITKILANILSLVISDLISDVQSAFVTNRQILDGPFIPNKFLPWCKQKKLKAMFFKVDFEKAFDSIRWDYLDDVLRIFGSGNKWRGWISGCLKSARGSVLVNGSPTSEFQFHKGLKHGDPLSPFLFILVMESIHLSFKRVMYAGLFSCIAINNSLTISNSFYADDAFFVGKWDMSNIKTVVNVLKCFHMASGLKLNIHKSKIMGVGI
ncbi:RNA-directed DNA polymerase, eukaryota [Tanacetum coccineum]